MKKSTSEVKHQIIQEYLNGGTSYRDLAREFEVDESNIRYWVKLYQYHGWDAFNYRYTTYTPAFKLGVLQYIERTGYSIREASAIFRIPVPSMVRRWKRKWEKGGIDALESSQKGQQDMTSPKKQDTSQVNDSERSKDDIISEVEYLRAENAYLKKLGTLVHKKSPTKSKHK